MHTQPPQLQEVSVLQLRLRDLNRRQQEALWLTLSTIDDDAIQLVQPLSSTSRPSSSTNPATITLEWLAPCSHPVLEAIGPAGIMTSRYHPPASRTHLDPFSTGANASVSAVEHVPISSRQKEFSNFSRADVVNETTERFGGEGEVRTQREERSNVGSSYVPQNSTTTNPPSSLLSSSATRDAPRPNNHTYDNHRNHDDDVAQRSSQQNSYRQEGLVPQTAAPQSRVSNAQILNNVSSLPSRPQHHREPEPTTNSSSNGVPVRQSRSSAAPQQQRDRSPRRPTSSQRRRRSVTPQRPFLPFATIPNLRAPSPTAAAAAPSPLNRNRASTPPTRTLQRKSEPMTAMASPTVVTFRPPAVGPMLPMTSPPTRPTLANDQQQQQQEALLRPQRTEDWPMDVNNVERPGLKSPTRRASAPHQNVVVSVSRSASWTVSFIEQFLQRVNALALDLRVIQDVAQLFHHIVGLVYGDAATPLPQQQQQQLKLPQDLAEFSSLTGGGGRLVIPSFEEVHAAARYWGPVSHLCQWWADATRFQFSTTTTNEGRGVLSPHAAAVVLCRPSEQAKANLLHFVLACRVRYHVSRYSEAKTVRLPLDTSRRDGTPSSSSAVVLTRRYVALNFIAAIVKVAIDQLLSLRRQLRSMLLCSSKHSFSSMSPTHHRSNETTRAAHVSSSVLSPVSSSTFPEGLQESEEQVLQDQQDVKVIKRHIAGWIRSGPSVGGAEGSDQHVKRVHHSGATSTITSHNAPFIAGHVELDAFVSGFLDACDATFGTTFFGEFASSSSSTSHLNPQRANEALNDDATRGANVMVQSSNHHNRHRNDDDASAFHRDEYYWNRTAATQHDRPLPRPAATPTQPTRLPEERYNAREERQEEEEIDDVSLSPLGSPLSPPRRAYYDDEDDVEGNRPPLQQPHMVHGLAPSTVLRGDHRSAPQGTPQRRSDASCPPMTTTNHYTPEQRSQHVASRGGRGGETLEEQQKVPDQDAIYSSRGQNQQQYQQQVEASRHSVAPQRHAQPLHSPRASSDRLVEEVLAGLSLFDRRPLSTNTAVPTTRGGGGMYHNSHVSTQQDIDPRDSHPRHTSNRRPANAYDDRRVVDNDDEKNGPMADESDDTAANVEYKRRMTTDNEEEEEATSIKYHHDHADLAYPRREEREDEAEEEEEELEALTAELRAIEEELLRRQQQPRHSRY